LHQLGRGDESFALLAKFGVTRKISTAVWRCVLDRESRPPLSSSDQHNRSNHLDPDSVRLIADALPTRVADNLRGAFNPDSAFWSETDYECRGYFSFWYDVSRPPRNIVEEAIFHHLLPKTGLGQKVVGAEWWVHSRMAGRNLGHQLHFDTEENALEINGEVLHPAVSSVCYLTGAGVGGPTVVFDQKAGDEQGADHALVSHPVNAACLFFPGDRLHGVLPQPPPANADNKTRRLTLMVGFWTTDVAKIGERFPLGPCGPMPKEDEAGCTWHHLLRLKKEKTTVSTSRIALAVPTSPLRLLPVHKVSPAWDHVPSVGEGGSSAGGGHDEGVLEFPDDVDQRFFVRSMHDFQAHLIERALASGGGSDGRNGGGSEVVEDEAAKAQEGTTSTTDGKYYACSGEVWG
jgi:hypothetical protein